MKESVGIFRVDEDGHHLRSCPKTDLGGSQVVMDMKRRCRKQRTRHQGTPAKRCGSGGFLPGILWVVIKDLQLVTKVQGGNMNCG